jgi:two-component system, cell cycle sensor histidine kinase and response regulator CckA
LAERFAPLRPSMRVLFASGYTEDAILQHGISSDVVAFLAKPFTPDDLLRKVGHTLEMPALGVGAGAN